MPGYELVLEQVEIAGVADLTIRRLKDRQQFHDPQGLAAAAGISSAAWPLFGLVWPSGLQLAAALARRPVKLGERILEVGCGLALASLVGHRRGAIMTASDCHPLTRLFLNENLRLNDLAPLPYRLGNWAQRDQDAADMAELAELGRLAALAALPIAAPTPMHTLTTEVAPGDARVRGEFDLIIGSDVLYERDDFGLLPGFIAQHAAQAGEVLIVDPNRGNRAAFHRRMACMGYEMNCTPLLQAREGGPPYRGQLFHYQRECWRGS